MNPNLKFTPDLLHPTPTGGWDVISLLENFAIITYEVDPSLLQKYLHPRFVPYTILDKNGNKKALVSAVPFFDLDFHFIKFPKFKFSFGQVNYRAYVLDTLTSENVVWFFGTVLDSWSVLIPKYSWKLPWHKADINIQTDWSEKHSKFEKFSMKTKSNWAGAELEVIDTGLPYTQISGFSDLETAEVILTHPLKGYFFQSNHRLGSYSVWHPRIMANSGTCKFARFDLFHKLGLVPFEKQQNPHSIFLQKQIEFTVYLPPFEVK